MKPTHVLRNFLYLDKETVDDFLAGIESGLYEEEQIKQTNEKGGSVTGKAGIPVIGVEGKGHLKKSKETTKQVILTDAAKFQRLYAHLGNDKAFEYYEVMSSETWSGLGRNSLLEGCVNISFSNIGTMADAVSNLSNLASVVEGVTGEPILDKDSKEAIQGFNELAKIEAEKGIPAKMTFVSSSEYTLVTYLKPDSLRVDRNQLVGEVTIFCKIQRMLSEGEKLELFDPLLAFSNLRMLNRQQRRELSKKKLPPEFRDTVKYPAAIVIPVAIYR